MKTLRIVVAVAFAVAAAAPAARADVSSDLRAFATLSAGITAADIAARRGAPLPGKDDEWYATGGFGASLHRCLVVDIASLDAMMGGTSSNRFSTNIQCDGPRALTTQRALLARAVAAMSPALPGFSVARHPANKTSDRASIVWTKGKTEVTFIAYGTRDYKDGDASRLGFNVSVSINDPDGAGST